jgi:hypothetical protein
MVQTIHTGWDNNPGIIYVHTFINPEKQLLLLQQVDRLTIFMTSQAKYESYRNVINDVIKQLECVFSSNRVLESSFYLSVSINFVSTASTKINDFIQKSV